MGFPENIIVDGLLTTLAKEAGRGQFSNRQLTSAYCLAEYTALLP